MSILDHVDNVLKKAGLKLDRANVDRVKPSREGYIEYDHFPIIKSDRTKVGYFVLDTYEKSVSTTTLSNATQAEHAVIKQAEQLVEDLISEIGE
ncbi:hypothetical protein KDJ21_005480 [Metabacillus litoralis]|uniref:hypothetical protein n=1 Tax=Metabacillus TaxID=2675233 RepID=UPI001B9954ED|nr:hypothetical protein [Metabacillus litoralis]UHA61115.1 hypothetical protein KDJ21_005480 [Metabacillus litoralis]